MPKTRHPLIVKRIPDWDAAAAYHDAWNKFVRDSHTVGADAAVPSLFQTYEWNHAWWSAYGENYELLLLGAFDGPTLVGVCPFLIDHKTFPIPRKIIRFIGILRDNYASDYCAIVTEKGRAEDVVRAVQTWLDANPKIWDEINLINMLGDSPELPALERQFEGRAHKYAINEAPTIVLGDPESDRDLVSRKSLKRHYNWFKNQGQLTYTHMETAEEMKAELQVFFDQHIGRRSATPVPSLFKCETHKHFYGFLVDEFIKTGWLRFFVVRLNGEAIAHHFGFEYLGKYYWYKPSFDVKFIKKSPGEVLLKTLFEYSIDKKLVEFDFTAGTEDFKYRFSNRVRKLYQYRIFRTPALFTLFKAYTGSRSLSAQILRKLGLKKPYKQGSDLG